MPRASRFAVLTALSAVLLVRPSAAGPWLLAPGEYYSEFQAGRFSADSYYDSDGVRYLTSEGARLETRSLMSTNEIGWRKWATLLLSAPAVSTTARLGPPYLERTETGLGDIDMGLRVKMIEGSSALSLQVHWLAPLGYQTNTFPTLGLGRSNITERLVFGTAIPKLESFVEGDVGIRYWTQYYGIQTVASARAGVWLGSTVLVAGHYDGEMALAGADSPGDDIDVHTVGPEVRCRLDDRFDVIAGSNHTAAGKNWYHADELYVGFAFRQTKLGRLQGFTGSKRRP